MISFLDTSNEWTLLLQGQVHPLLPLYNDTEYNACCGDLEIVWRCIIHPTAGQFTLCSAELSTDACCLYFGRPGFSPCLISQA